MSSQKASRRTRCGASMRCIISITTWRALQTRKWPRARANSPITIAPSIRRLPTPTRPSPTSRTWKCFEDLKPPNPSMRKRWPQPWGRMAAPSTRSKDPRNGVMTMRLSTSTPLFSCKGKAPPSRSTNGIYSQSKAHSAARPCSRRFLRSAI